MKNINLSNSKGDAALHMASTIADRKGILKMLVKHGTDIWQEDKKGRNALHLASENGNYEAASFLIAKAKELCSEEKFGYYINK